jgi:WD40-like Beta Propeller Repeat
MLSALLHVPKALRFAPDHALKFFAFLFLGLVCAGYCGAQKPTKKPPKPIFWVVFDAESGWDSCSPRDIYVMDQKGEHVTRITSNHRSHNPSWSPDAHRILFLQDECKPAGGFNLKYLNYESLRNILHAPRDVFWMDANGRHSSFVAAMGPNAQDALWAPDGEHIAVRMADKRNLLVHIRERPVPPNHQSEEPLSRFLDIEGPQVSVVSPFGAELEELTPPVENFLPTFYAFFGNSSDSDFLAPGHKLQYAADLGASLQVVTLAGAPASAPMPAFDIAWSRDGTRIAYSSFTDGQNSILYVADLHGDEASAPRALTGQELDSHGPAWSADSSRLAFTGLWKDSSQIFIINADGSNLIQLSRNPNKLCNHVSWSPDGKRIAAACSENSTLRFGFGLGGEHGGRSEIYLFDTSKPAAKPRRLTRCGYVYPSSRDQLCGALNPSFAPAGTVIP